MNSSKRRHRTFLVSKPAIEADVLVEELEVGLGKICRGYRSRTDQPFLLKKYHINNDHKTSNDTARYGQKPILVLVYH